LKENAVLLIFERQRRPTSLRACSKAKIVRQRRLAGKLGQDVTGQSDRHRVRPAAAARGGRIAKRQDDVADMAMCRSSGQTGTQGNTTSRRRLSAAGKRAPSRVRDQQQEQQSKRPGNQASNVAPVAARGQKQGSKRADGQECVLYVCVWRTYALPLSFFSFTQTVQIFL
jgi:hypothetical protein